MEVAGGGGSEPRTVIDVIERLIRRDQGSCGSCGR